jgi:coenzyme PQQ synthesis protein D (PqqD)
MASDADNGRSILAARVAIPEHVVRRAFARETVALNLETGEYHGLNPTAARMLEEIARRGVVAHAVQPLSDEYGQPAEMIERDLVALCRALADRGLIELDGARAS